MPVSLRVHITPNLAEVRLQSQVAATLAFSAPIVTVPVAFQVPTRHSMSVTGLGNASAPASAGIVNTRAVIAFERVVIVVSLTLWRSDRRYAVPPGGTSRLFSASRASRCLAAAAVLG